MPHRRPTPRPSMFLVVLLPALACTTEPEVETSRHLLRTVHGDFDPAYEALPGLDGVAPVMVAAKRPYLVQFESAVRPVWREALEVAGVEVRDYLPEDAYLVSATPEAAERARALPGVRAVVEQKPVLRLDPRLLPSELGPSEGIASDLQVEVTGVDAQLAVAQAVSALGGEVVDASGTGRMLRVRLEARAAPLLAAREDVVFVAPSPQFRLFNDDARWSVQAGPSRPGETPLHDRGIRGQDQIVAFADSGLDESSCYFAGDKILSYEDWTGSGNRDEIGHGTHVGGSIAGDKNADGLADTYDGLAPAARLYVQDVGSGNWGLSGVPVDLASLFGPAYESGARIHSNSWGSETPAYDGSARSLDLFVRGRPDLLVLVANGNSGPSARTVGSPATAKNVISVGASHNGAQIGTLAYFSSQGPTSDGRIKPTLAAPGAQITSARAGYACDVATESGTSMACPTLAGGATLVRQYFTDGWYPTGEKNAADGFEPSAALIKAALITGAAPMTGEYAGGFPGNGMGFGRADLDASLYFAGDPSPQRLWVSDVAAGVSLGEEASYELVLDERGPLKVALTWTDPPGSTSASRALVNDLDLRLTSPTGEVYLGNVFQQGRSTAGGEADSLNVEELIWVPAAAAGTWVVTVVGTNVPQGPQSFAVAAGGPVVVDGQADPTPGPGPGIGGILPCEDATFSPAEGAVGWVRSGDPDVHHLGDDDIYAGRNQGQVHYGIIQFDLGPWSEVSAERLTLTLTGQTTEYLNGGVFRFELIELDPLSGATDYQSVANAPVLAEATRTISSTEVGGWLENLVELPGEALGTGPVTIRVRGDVATDSVMSWDSGYGNGGIGKPPTLGMCVMSGIDLAPLGELRLTEAEAFSMDLTLNKTTGRTVLFAADTLPEGASLDAMTGHFEWTPSYEQAGRHQVVFTATDGAETDLEVALFFVENVNRPPHIEELGRVWVLPDDTVELEVLATDPDGDDLEVTSSELPEGATFEGGLFRWTPRELGSWEVLFAADDGNLRYSEAVTIEVVEKLPREARDGGREVKSGCASASGTAGVLALLLVVGAFGLPRRRSAS